MQYKFVYGDNFICSIKLMYYRLKSKKAFTLAETLIVCTIFAVMVLWIILWINRAFAFMNTTRVVVRATNFAREWVEMVYNIRDTNRRKYSGEKDKHRMDAFTGDAKLEAWIYVIKEWTTGGNNSYIYAESLTGNSDYFYSVEWFFSDGNQSLRNKSKIVFTWSYSYYSGGSIATWNLEDLLWWTWIKFYRILRVFGVYKKDMTNPQGGTTNYTNADPKELRFCVKVFYTYNGWNHASELCSIMTNFME